MTNRIKQTVWRRAHIESVFFAIAMCQTRSQAESHSVSTAHAAFSSPECLLAKLMTRRPRSLCQPFYMKQGYTQWTREEVGRIPMYALGVPGGWLRIARTSSMVHASLPLAMTTRALRTTTRSKRTGQDETKQKRAQADEVPTLEEAHINEHGGKRHPEEDLEYWRSCMELADRPSAIRLLKKIDLSNPLGVKPKERPPGRKAETLLDVYMKTRKRHPRKVILCRVGDFYEAFGYCAVLLVQFAGLNPMGSALPRAGCPVVNLRRTLQDLTDAGFSVVIMEEKPIPWGLKNRKKDRYIAGFATPASPIYVHGMTLSTSSSDLTALDQSPIVGIASLSVRGFLLYEISLDTRSCKVMEGMTEEAVMAHLTAARCSPPLYLHSELPPALAARLAAMAAHYHWRIDPLPGSLSTTTDAAAGSFLLNLLDAVRLDLDLSPADEFTVATTTTNRRPRPLYLTTAAQVGVLPKDGIPSLIDSLVPSKAEALVKAFLRRWLLHPPPPEVASELQLAVRRVAALEAAEVLPVFRVLSAAKIARYITAGEANIAILADLHATLSAAHATLQDQNLKDMTEGLLRATRFETGVGRCDAGSVMEAAREVTKDVEDTIILLDGCGGAGEAETAEEDGEGSHEVEKEEEGGDGADVEGDEEGAWYSLERLVVLSETFANKVHRRCAEDAFSKVDQARDRLRAVMRDELLPIVRKLNEDKPKTAKKRARVQLDVMNLAVWIKAGSSISREQTSSLKLLNPRDRMAKLIPDAFVTEEALEAITAYRQACEDASDSVREVLRSLSARIAKRLPEVINGIVFCTLAKTVVLHVGEASRKGWCIPDLPDAAPKAPKVGSDGVREKAHASEELLAISDMIPFWMDPNVYAPRVVPNTVSIGGMVVLTGPNTAGKSTVMRSLCAVSLLGNCGLMVPAKAAVVPYQDSYYLRAASYDAPAEGLSSFAVEILDTATILRDASRHTMVLVDELGKGTETRAGSAIAGAVLEQLNRLRCRGVFTTHLHEIFDLPLDLEGVRNMRMGIEMRADQSWSPTWTVVEGRCVDSLAVHAAEKYGLPPDIVQRARRLAKLRDGGGLGELVAFGPSAPPALRVDEPQCGGAGDDSHSSEKGEEAVGRCGEGEVKGKRRARIPAEARRSMEDAIAVMQRVCVDLRVPTTEQVILVDRKSTPPPTAGSHASVYVARTFTGWFYVGETDHLPTRIDVSVPHQLSISWRLGAFVTVGAGQNHRRKPRMKAAAFACMQVLKGGKSVARRFEASLIQELVGNGFPMLAQSDALHRQFAADDNFDAD